MGVRAFHRYTERQLEPYTAAVNAAGQNGGGVIGLGLWYYVTIPRIRIYPVISLRGLEEGLGGGCAINLESIFDSIKTRVTSHHVT